ncbi:MAG: hypothetical protein Q9208_008022 [Pyrenodesmia sp. 3 TL-2023]
MAEEITLFDIPSTPPNKAWSSNPWKTRLVLNYKALPYRTHWLEFPDIAPCLKSHDIPPNAQGIAYTVPTIHFPSSRNHPKDEYIMESRAIAIALETAYPEPSLHLDAPQLAKIEELRGQAFGTLIGVVGRRILATLLNESSKEYLEASTDLSGCPDGDEAWNRARPALEAIGALLKEAGGPFVMGETVSQLTTDIAALRARSQSTGGSLSTWQTLQTTRSLHSEDVVSGNLNLPNLSKIVPTITLRISPLNLPSELFTTLKMHFSNFLATAFFATALPVLSTPVQPSGFNISEYQSLGCPNTTKPSASQQEQLQAIISFDNLLVQKQLATAFNTYAATNFINHVAMIPGNGTALAIQYLVPALNTTSLTLLDDWVGSNAQGVIKSTSYLRGDSQRRGLGVIVNIWRLVGTCLVEFWQVGAPVMNSTNPIAYF